MPSFIDDHFLPGVSFTLDNETLPARECAWAMYASCGCISGLHMMTVDTMTEAAAWKQMSGDAQMIKQDKARGFTIRMVKHREVPFDDCPHNPKWGYMPTPIPPEHSWAAASGGRVRHLVPLIPSDDEESKDEWAQDWRTKITSLCGRTSEIAVAWSRKWYRLDGKADCTHCAKVAEGQALL